MSPILEVEPVQILRLRVSIQVSYRRDNQAAHLADSGQLNAASIHAPIVALGVPLHDPLSPQALDYSTM